MPERSVWDNGCKPTVLLEVREEFMLIPQVRQARKYPNSPWEMIHPPGDIMQYVRDPTRATRLGVPSHSQPLINTKYQVQVTNYLQTIF
jgi:hypothetical protein